MKCLRPRVATLDLRTARPAAKTADPFYLRPEWRGLVDGLIAQRGRRCEACGRVNCRIFADHIVELKDGGAALDPTNLRLLCGACHGRKTAASRAARTARPIPTRG